MFPQVIRAVRTLQPRAILVENVRGLLRKSFASYFGYIVLQLEHPEIVRRDEEPWTDHLARLEKQHTSGTQDGLRYQILFRLVNAANYGVPQKRDRVFLVGFRSDLKAKWSFPDETHSLDALLYQQWVTGEYWERNKVPARQRPDIPARIRRRVDSPSPTVCAAWAALAYRP